MPVDKDKVGKTVNKVMKVLNDSDLNTGELLLLVGNLTYHIGAAIGRIKGTGPGQEDLEKEYYRNPTVDTALMLNGLLETAWVDDFEKQPKLSKFANIPVEERKE
jgi:hypothetical protein